MIGVVIVIAIVMWLIANIVIPVALLNSALICTILAWIFKERRTAFASVALFGGCYMLLDISKGWLSANFVHNVVHTALWLTGFVYINAAAVGVSTWLLLRPLFVTAALHARANSRKALWLSSGAIGSIFAATITLPIIYHVVSNPFTSTALQIGLPAQTTAATTNVDSVQSDLVPSAGISEPMATITLSSFSVMPRFIVGCSSVFSESRSAFEARRYIYVDNLDTQGQIIVNGKPVILKSVFPVTAPYSSQYSNGEYTAYIKIVESRDTGREGETIRGVLTVKRGSVVVLTLPIYGGRGC